MRNIYILMKQPGSASLKFTSKIIIDTFVLGRKGQHRKVSKKSIMLGKRMALNVKNYGMSILSL